jgi:glycosyltransferase involved in cell wall biosynthesis
MISLPTYATRESAQPSAGEKPALVRVLHVINGEDYSGAERVQDRLALRLPECGFDVSFACVRPNRFAQAREAQQAPLFELGMRSRGDLSPIFRMSRLIRQEKFALVHTHGARAALVGRPAAMLAGVPMVHHVHCQTSTEVRRQWLSRISGLVERVSIHRAAGVIAVSSTLRAYLLEQGYPADNLWLVPNGVPTASTAQETGDRKTCWTIGVVAMFRPRKGIEVLLESIALLRAEDLPVRLRAVGRFQSPQYEHEVKSYCQSLGLNSVVQWTGFRQDVSAELARLDIFVLPSLISEAMPMSILEAMAAGVPVVGTRVDGVTDLISHARNGLLAEPGDPLDLARVLKQLIAGEIDGRLLSHQARVRQQTSFSEESMAAGVAQIYRTVLSRAGDSRFAAMEARVPA